MEEIKKKIYLFIFVVAVLNGFYCLVMGQYYLLIWITITLMVAYFSIFPEEFFLCINNAKEHIDNYRRNRQTSNTDIQSSYREERIEEENIDIPNKRSDNSLSSKIY
jgi:hypothetical protein